LVKTESAAASAEAAEHASGEPSREPNKIGSERESVKPLILGRILQNHEFGPAGRHVLGLQQQVA